MEKEFQFLIYNTPAISNYPKYIFEDGDLSEEVVVSKMEMVVEYK